MNNEKSAPKDNDICKICKKINPIRAIRGCGKYMGYRHLSGEKAICGDDVGTHIIYCNKCKKKFCECQKFVASKEERVERQEKKKMKKKIDNFKAVLELANPEDKEYLLNKFNEIFVASKDKDRSEE